MKYSNFFPVMNRISVLSEQWCKEVEKRTNGRVKVNYYPAGTLTPPGQTYDAVTKGIADIGLSFASYTHGRFPLTEVLDLPLGSRSAYQGMKLANAYYKKFRPKEFDDVKVMYLHTSGPHYIFARKPINSLEDLKGLKIRSTGTSTLVVKALGGLPVGMPMSDAYDALSRGVTDGISAPFEAMHGFKLADVVNYCAQYDRVYVNAAYVVMNKSRWQGLPADVQRTIEAVNEEWAEKQGRLWDELDKEGREVFLKKGGKTGTLSGQENARWTAHLSPVLDDYVKEMKAKNLPGDEALKFCVDYLKAHP